MPERLDYPPSVVRALLDACERTPATPSLIFESERLTYAGLRHQALRWAGALRAWGLQPGDRVALFLENSPDFVAAYLGTHLAGGIVVPVNTQYRQVELRHILGDSGARLCVTDALRLDELARVADELAGLEAAVLVGADEPQEPNDKSTSTTPVHRASFAVFSRDAFLGEAGAETPTLPKSGDIALIAYTSGTTGRSKGAMLTHSNLAANSAAVTRAWRWTAADYLLLTLPLFHVHGLCVGMHGAWLTGSTVELHRRFDAGVVYRRLLAGAGRPSPGDGASGEAQRVVSMFFGVPTMYTRLIAEAQRSEWNGRRPAPLRLYVSGSAPLSPQTFEDFERLFGQRILERYGMSETIMNLTNPYDPSDGERRPGTVGMPFPGQQARVVNVVSREPILDRRPGEIQVRGPHVFKGYWRRPDATAEAFDAEGWFNTGDLGWRSVDGYYTISGRARELIISGGYNIYPREVEEVLQTHPAVAEAAVFGEPDPEFGEQVAAAVVRAPAQPDTSGGPTNDDAIAQSLVALCRDQLAGYKKPRRIYFVGELPRNALGKVQKHLLRQILDDSGVEPIIP